MTGFIIADGIGRGYKAKVTKDNLLSTYTVSASLQHVISESKENAYQVIGTATLASGTVVGLFINNTTTKDLVITYCRHQIIGASGGTSFPNSSNYFSIALNRTYSSGGSVATPVNVNVGSGKSSGVTCYHGNPTLSGTSTDIDRWYTKADGDMNIFNKEGALILKPNNTLELSYTGDQTGGLLYTRLSFVFDDFM